MTWTGFTGVFLLFFATHSIPVRPAVRSKVVAYVGTRGFGIGYSTLSLAMLALLVWAAREAPYIELWPQQAWHRHFVHAGMLVVCLILAFSIGRPNPLSFGGARNDSFDPKRSGIIRIMRHPVLVALALWAFLHMLPNGDLAHAILFGVLGGFAVAGRLLIDRRKRQELGASTWYELTSHIADAPVFSRPISWPAFCLRLVAAFALFAALLALHPVIIGVPAL